MTVPPDDASEVTLPQRALRQLLASTKCAVQESDVRPYTQGLLLGLQPGSVEMVAASGVRLARAAVSVEHGVSQAQAIVPTKTATELEKLLDDTDDPVRVRLMPS